MAKSISLAITSAPVRRLNRVDFPALVYPTKATIGNGTLPVRRDAGCGFSRPYPIDGAGAPIVHQLRVCQPQSGFHPDHRQTPNHPLPFKVGPCPHQACALIGQMRHFHLQHTFAGGRTIRKDFKDQTRSIKDLDLPFLFQIALLHGCDGSINQDQFNLMIVEQRFQLFQLTFPKQLPGCGFGSGTNVAPATSRFGRPRPMKPPLPRRVRPDGGQDQILCQDAEPMRGLASHHVISTWLFAFV